MRQARLPKQKTLADYNFNFPKRIPKTAIVRLFDCDFIPRHGCAVLIGPTGPGKSHLQAWSRAAGGFPMTSFARALGLSWPDSRPSQTHRLRRWFHPLTPGSPAPNAGNNSAPNRVKPLLLNCAHSAL